jgi:type III secretion protein L
MAAMEAAEAAAEAAAQAAAQQLEVVSRTVAWFGEVESRMVEVVAAAVRRIVGEIEEGELVCRIVHEAMRTMRNQRQVTVRVAPEAVDDVQRQLTGIMADYPGITFVEVTADSRLRRGGCILESELGTVDASVEVQLEALARALQRAFSHTV